MITISLTRKKCKGIVLILFFSALTLAEGAKAQIYVKAEMLGTSKYHDAASGDIPGKGSAYVLRGGVQLPVSVKIDTLINGLETTRKIWGISLDGTYTNFNNQGLESYNFPSNIYNCRAGLVHLRTINKNWSLMARLGAGLYTSSSVTFRQVIGEGTLLFLRELTPNLKLGVGVALDNTFGFPMIYPGLFADWALDGRQGKYYLRFNSNEFKAGAKFNDHFQLSIITSAFGASVLEKDRMFTHIYYSTGVTPEFKVNKYLTILTTVGLTAPRNMYAHDRTITDFFSYLLKDRLPYFSVSPYASISLNFGK